MQLNVRGSTMDYVDIEKMGKRIFERFPIIKRLCKRIYQLASYASSQNKVKSEGIINCVSPNDGYEYFYGYYDKSPWDAKDRYMIALKVRHTYRYAAPKESGELVIIDTHDKNKIIKIGIVHAWNVQQGCMAQWLGPDFKTMFIYNDFRDGKYCSVIFNLEIMQEVKVLPLPIYDVARDGSFALSLDFSRLHRLRPGYGYYNLPDSTAKEPCPDKTCIWRMDLETGNVRELLKYTDMAAFETSKSMVGAEHKVNHPMISPSGKRIMVLHRWFRKGRKYTRLVTMNDDGSDMYNLSDDVFVSHCYWKNDREILSFLRKSTTGDHYYLMKDKTQEYELYWPRLSTDGHCSYSPDRSLIITDSYPNRKRQAFVYVCKEEQAQPVRIATVFAPFRYDNACRCDLHPRWNHAGDKICIDSVHRGKRAMYVIPIEKKDIPAIPGKKAKYQAAKYKIVYIITRCKNSGPMNQTLNIIKNLDRRIFQPIVITLFLEDLSDSVIQRFLDIVSEFHCLAMGRVSSLINGKQRLHALLDKIKPDLIHGLGMPPYTMSLCYVKAVHLVTLRNYCYQDYPDKYGRILGVLLAHKDMKLIKKQISRGETFITCSESLSNIYKEKHHMQMGFIRNGVNTEQYLYADYGTKHAMKEKLGFPLAKTVVGYSGQFIDRKDQQFAIEGMISSRYADDILMVFMGAGPNLEYLKEKYGNDSRLLFTGMISNVYEYLQACDLYISTSKSEGLPNGVLEAMSVGLPVLLSDIEQHLEVLEIGNGYGLSYRLGLKQDFIDKFDKILKQDLYLMGEKAKEAVDKKLSASYMSNNYQKLYLSLISKAEGV